MTNIHHYSDLKIQYIFSPAHRVVRWKTARFSWLVLLVSAWLGWAHSWIWGQFVGLLGDWLVQGDFISESGCWPVVSWGDREDGNICLLSLSKSSLRVVLKESGQDDRVKWSAQVSWGLDSELPHPHFCYVLCWIMQHRISPYSRDGGNGLWFLWKKLWNYTAKGLDIATHEKLWLVWHLAQGYMFCLIAFFMQLFLWIHSNSPYCH